MADNGAEEKPPEFESAVETLQLEWLDAEAAVAEQFCRAVDGVASFGSGVAERGTFQNPDANGAEIVFGVSAEGDGRGMSIASVGTGHDFEKRAHIGDGAGHGADDANPAKRAGARGKVARGGNAARRGLESADAAKVRGDADGAAAVAANAACGASRGDGCGFAAARAAGGICKIPRVTGLAVEEIVGFVGHQKFGSVGVAEKNGARGFEPGDERSIGLRDVLFAEKRAGGTGPGSDVNAALDGEGNAMKRAKRRAARD